MFLHSMGRVLAPPGHAAEPRQVRIRVHGGYEPDAGTLRGRLIGTGNGSADRAMRAARSFG